MICIVTIYENKPFETIQFFSSRFIIEKLSVQGRWLIKKIKLIFDDNNQERKPRACLGQNCSKSLIVFFSQLFVILLIIFGWFWRIHLSKTCDGSIVWVGILYSDAAYILPSPRPWKLSFYKKSRLHIIGRSLRDGKVTTSLQLAKKWNLSTKIWHFLQQHSQTLYGVLQKKIENLEFIQVVNFEFIDLLQHNGTKYLLIVDNSCEKICNSKALVDIATSGRHRGLSTFYNKHDLFHQSKLGRDAELRNTHLVHFKSARDMMQVSMLSAQLGLGSQLVDWYRNAASVPYGHLLIDLSPRTDGSSTLLYKHRIHSLKISYPGPTETVKNFGRRKHRFSLLSKCSNHFPTNAKVFSFSLAQKRLSGFLKNA